jgi:cobalt transporter subunit CbtA
MFRNLVLSAFGAGLAVAVVVTALQFATTEPLILHAEEFEQADPGARDRGSAAEATQSAHLRDRDDAAWQPTDGLERTLYTALANLVVGVAVSLMLLAAMALKGDPIDARRGLLWGLAGFVAASLLPSLGLPPELPGTPAAELTARQTWWLATAIASAGGLALCVFGRHWGWAALGVALLVAPHLIGAPQPPSHDAAYPAGLAGEFVAASIAVSAVLWSLCGLGSGWLYRRLSGGT